MVNVSEKNSESVKRRQIHTHTHISLKIYIYIYIYILLWENIVLILVQKTVYSLVSLLLPLNFKEGVGGAGLPPLDNALPYQGRLLSGFLSQALALLLQMRNGV